MSSRFWVGGTGTWDATTTTNWSATSGGAGGASVPAATDDVFLDGNSGTGTVTVSTAVVAGSVICTGYAGTFALTGANLQVAGALTFSSAMTLTSSAAVITFTATTTNGGAGWAITTAGKSLPSITFNGTGGKWVCADALTSVNVLTLTAGIWDTSGFSISCVTFSSSNSNTRTLTLGSSPITITGSNNAWLISTATGLTMTANTATITMTNASGGFNQTVSVNGASLVWSGNGAGNIANTLTGVNNITVTSNANKTTTFALLGNLTCTGTFTFNGNSSVNRSLLQSSTVGTARTITAATVSISNADFMDITAAGAANWNLSAITGGSGDAGGNSGITFTAAQTNYWIGNGSNWSSVGKWASTSGGVGSTGRIPLPQDTARFDANSFTSAGQTVTMDMPRQAKDIDFTGALNNPTWTFSIASIIYGSLTLVSGMTWTAGSLALSFAGRGTHTITSAGRSSSVIATINSVGGSYTLQDAFATGNGITLSSGTFDTGSMALTCSTFTSTGSSTRALTLGTSTVSLTGASSTLWNVASTGLTLSAASSTIAFTLANVSQRNFTGGGLTYGTLTYTVAASTGILLIQGSNTFGTINISGGARTLQLTSGTTTTVTNWNVFGLVGAVVTVNSSTAASAATISRTSGFFGSDYLSVQDITGAVTGATYYMGSRSTNVSGNTGLTFTDAPGQRFWVGGTGTWDGATTTNWALFSGATGGIAAPTATDSAYFDANSGGGTVSIASSAATCLNWDSTGYTGSFAGGGGTASILGNITIGSGVTAMGFFAMKPATGTTSTLTTNGRTLSAFDINGVGTVSFQDAVTSSSTMNHIIGTLLTNNFAVTLNTWTSTGTGTRTLTLGSSAVTLSTSSGAAINWSVATGFTLTAHTSTFTISGASANISINNGTIAFNNVVYSGAGAGAALTPNGSSFVNLTVTGLAAKTGTFSIGGNFSVTGTFTVTGNNVTNRILVQSATVGTSRTVTSAANSFSNVDFMDITGAGAGSWNLSAITGGSGDAGGNSGITFTTAVTRYGVVAGNWSSTATWSTTSGGAGGASVPLPQDTVILDANSAAGTYTRDMPRIGKDINCTGFTRTLTAGIAHTAYGSVTFSAGMTLTSSGFPTTVAGRGTHTLTSAGQSWTGGFTIFSPGGTYTLADAFGGASTVFVTHTMGSFDTASFSMTLGTFSSTGANVRSLTLGTSTVSLTSTGSGNIWNLAASGLTVSAASSTIVVTAASANTRFFQGASFTYGTLTYTVANSPGALSITGANTFGTLNVGPGRTLTFQNAVTNTVTNWNVAGGIGGNLLSANAADIETDATAWSGMFSNSTLSRTTSVAFQNTASLAVTSGGAAATPLGANTVANVAVTPGVSYTGQIRALAATTARGSASLRLRWYQADGTTASAVSAVTLGATGTDATGTWTSFVVTGAAPSDAAFARLEFVWNITTTAGEVHYLDAGVIVPATILNSSTSGSAATLSKASGYIASDYVSVQDITGTGGATFYMGSRSTNVSGNTGLTFTDAPQRYWVGGTATWDAATTTNWAVVSGGTGGLAVPTATEDVYLDANSSGTVTLGASANMKSFIATGFTGTLAGGGFRMSINGTVFMLSSTMTLSGTFLPWSLVGGGVTTTVTTAGKVLSGGLTVSNSGITQADAISVGTDQINYNSGTWTTSGFSITADTFTSSTTNTRVLTLSNSTLTFSGSFSSHGWQVTGPTGLTISANTATVVLTGQSAHFTGSSAITVNGMSLSMTGSGLPQIDNATTFANVTRIGTAVKTDGLAIIATLTCTGTFTVTGNSVTNRLLVQSNVVGTSRTIIAAAVSVANADFMDIVGAGAGNWNLSLPTTTPSWTAGGTGGNLLTTADATMSSVANWMMNTSPTGSTITLDSTYGSDGTTSGLVTRGSGSGTGYMQADQVVTRYVAAASGQYFALIATIRNNASTARQFSSVVNGWNAGGGWLGAASAVSTTNPTIPAGGTGQVFAIYRMPTDNTMATMTPSFSQTTGVVGDTWNIDQVGVYAVTPGGSGDAGGNSGITFTTGATNYWVGGTGNWSDVTHWANSSGGVGGTGRVPLPQGTARFDANSFTAAGQTVTTDMPRLAKDIDWTGATNTPTWTSAISLTMFGSMTLVSGMVRSTFSGGMVLGGRGSHTITTAGNTAMGLVLQGPGGTYTQQDALTVGGGGASTVQVSNGTLNTNGFALTCSTLTSTGTATRGLTLGTSTISLTATSGVVWNVSATGLTLSAASSTILIATASASSRFFTSSSGSQTYGTLTYTVAASTGLLSITNASQTFGAINVSGGARTLTFLSSGTTTVTNWNVFGTAGNLVTINASTPGAAATLIKGDSVLTGSDYLSIQDITASPGSIWYAGTHSTDASGNTGWTFSDPFISSSSASLTLSASGAVRAPITATAALALLATNTALAAPASGTASVVLTGTVAAKATATGTASVVLVASGTAKAPVTGAAAMVLLTAPATARASVTSTTAALTITAATATAFAPIAPAAALVLTAVNAAVQAKLSANATLLLVASVVTGYLGRRDVQVAFGTPLNKVVAGVPVLYLITTGVPSI